MTSSERYIPQLKMKKTMTGNDEKPQIITKKATIEKEQNEPIHSWIALIGITVCLAIMNGTIMCFGQVYVELLDLYNEGPLRTSLVMTASGICFTVSGFMFGFLSHHVTARWVVVPSGVISCLAYLVSAFSPSLIFIFLSYSIIVGCCNGAAYIYCFRMVNLYFNKRRVFANGIANVGNAFAILFFPPIARVLIDTYSVRGFFLICAGLWLKLSVTGSLLRPVDVGKSNRSKGVENHAFSKECTSEAAGPDKASQKTENKPEAGNRNKQIFTYNKAKVKTHIGNEIILNDQVHFNSETEKGLDQTFQSINGQHIPKGGKEMNQDYSNGKPEVWIINLDADDGDAAVNPKHNQHPSNSKTPKSLMQSLCTFQCLLRAIHWLIAEIVVVAPLSYIPAYAVDLEIPLSQASFYISIIGGFDLAGRLTLGYLGDKKFCSQNALIGTGFLVSGTVTLLLPVFESETYFIFYSVIFGATHGMFLVFVGPMSAEVFGLEHVGTGIGIFSLCFGMASGILPFIFSPIKEMTGSYSLGFWIVGGANILNAFIAVIVQLLCPRNRRPIEDKTQETVLYEGYFLYKAKLVTLQVFELSFNGIRPNRSLRKYQDVRNIKIRA